MPGRIVALNIYPTDKVNAFSDARQGVQYPSKGAKLSRVWESTGSVEMSLPQSEKASDDLAMHLLGGQDQLVKWEVVTDIFSTSNAYPKILTPNGNGVIKKFSGDEVNAPDGYWDFSGPDDFFATNEWCTDQAEILTNVTVGQFLQAYNNRIYNNGDYLMPGLPDTRTDEFNWDQDSDGKPWDKTISLKIGPGVTFTQLMQALSNYQMHHFDVRAGHLITRLWTDTPAQGYMGYPYVCELPAGMIVDSPLTVDVSDLASRYVFQAADTVTDPNVWSGKSIMRYYNLERTVTAYESQGNISNKPDMDDYIRVHEFENTHAAFQKTVKYQANVEDQPVPLPMIDFNNGDFVKVRPGNSLLSRHYTQGVLRVRQWTIEEDDDGDIWVTVVLNDFVQIAEDKIVSAVNGITGGSTVVGRSTAVRKSS